MLRRPFAVLAPLFVVACATPALTPPVIAPPAITPTTPTEHTQTSPPDPLSLPRPVLPVEVWSRGPRQGEGEEKQAADRLTSQGYVTWIYARPRVDAHFIGYVRNGSSIAVRGAGLVRGEGCPRGFYPVEPRGFVCNDRTVTHAPSARSVETAAATAGSPGAFPYRYAFSDGAPMHNRVPTVAEQQRTERGFGPAGDRRSPYARRSVYQDLASLAAIPATDPFPPFLEGGGTAAEDRRGLVKDSLPAGSLVSFTRAFVAAGRTWLLAANQTLVPADRVRAFAASRFHGVRLGEDVHLPLAWMRGAARPQYRRLPSGAFVATEGAWPVRSFVRLSGPTAEHDGQRYLETLDGDADGAPLFVSEKDATVAAVASQLPTGVTPGQKWMAVSITRGTLVAYEGLTPVYATLVSPGRGGVGSAGRSSRDEVADSTTPLGTYHITFKDRAATMSPDKPGERTHFIADVPHVQYFKAPFALHAAYWHERFGEPASAGCINASPLDAEALFDWSDPPVPDGWQGATGAGAPGNANGKTTAIVVGR